ncbi:MAG: hypothetical protein JW895_02825 [Thermoleophilaceae bacterium]|nr:hypothetical protein [Thermoleophilaceae bacterium]
MGRILERYPVEIDDNGTLIAANRERTTALAVYAALTLTANERRERTEFEASRQGLAAVGGTTDRTVDKYVAVFEELGILEVARRPRGGLHLPNLWTLVDAGDPKQVRLELEAASPPEAKQIADALQKNEGQEVVSLHSRGGGRGRAQLAALPGGRQGGDTSQYDPPTMR